MKHRFLLEITLPEAARLAATGQPITPHQLEALALAATRWWITSELGEQSPAGLALVTEPAPERSAL